MDKVINIILKEIFLVDYQLYIFSFLFRCIPSCYKPVYHKNRSYHSNRSQQDIVEVRKHLLKVLRYFPSISVVIYELWECCSKKNAPQRGVEEGSRQCAYYCGDHEIL